MAFSTGKATPWLNSSEESPEPAPQTLLDL